MGNCYCFECKKEILLHSTKISILLSEKGQFVDNVVICFHDECFYEISGDIYLEEIERQREMNMDEKKKQEQLQTDFDWI